MDNIHGMIHEHPHDGDILAWISVEWRNLDLYVFHNSNHILHYDKKSIFLSSGCQAWLKPTKIAHCSKQLGELIYMYVFVKVIVSGEFFS